MTPTILLCTVGGSHQPIVTALREVCPAYTCFFCTGKDPATGRAGSCQQVNGRGNPVELRRADGTIEHLPAIPVQAGLDPKSYGVEEVPADDLDAAVTRMLEVIAALAARFPDARLVADYTGGTKTMTAALVMAALESERVALRLVTGTRGDLVRVHDGSQAGLEVAVEGIRLRRAMAPYVAAWGRHAYGEAAEGLARIPVPSSRNLRGELLIARDTSRALDAWDCFDHARALTLLDVYRPRLGATFGRALSYLGILASPDDTRRTPARLWDLWLNAQRRAGQGRYDDAVARLYRLLEWTAQWTLKARGIDTADLRPEQVPPGLDISPNRDGKLQAGLFAAWELVAAHTEGPAARFAVEQRERMLTHILARNASILAHGDKPVDRTAWDGFRTWAEEALVPVLRDAGTTAGLRGEPEQLPVAPIWGDTPT